MTNKYYEVAVCDWNFNVLAKNNEQAFMKACKLCELVLETKVNNAYCDDIVSKITLAEADLRNFREWLNKIQQGLDCPYEYEEDYICVK